MDGALVWAMREIAMRQVLFAASAAGILGLLAAAGCSPQGAPGAKAPAGAAAGGGPGVTAEFLLEDPDKADGQTGPLAGKFIRAGDKVRMEFSDPSGKGGFAMILDGASALMLITDEAGKVTGIKAPNMASLAKGQPGGPDDIFSRDWTKPDPTATVVGPCNVAGEPGKIYRSTSEGVSAETCFGDVGVPLEVKQGDKTIWRTTKVTRGTPDAALFIAPAGVEILDMEAMLKGLGIDPEKMMKELEKAK